MAFQHSLDKAGKQNRQCFSEGINGIIRNYNIGKRQGEQAYNAGFIIIIINWMDNIFGEVEWGRAGAGVGLQIIVFFFSI